VFTSVDASFASTLDVSDDAFSEDLPPSPSPVHPTIHYCEVNKPQLGEGMRAQDFVGPIDVYQDPPSRFPTMLNMAFLVQHPHSFPQGMSPKKVHKDMLTRTKSHSGDNYHTGRSGSSNRPVIIHDVWSDPMKTFKDINIVPA
jgi:hypothetical protein